MPMHLKSNGPQINVPFIFWYLNMTFSLCFDHQMWVKLAFLSIRNSSEHTKQNHSRFAKSLWMFGTE